MEEEKMDGLVLSDPSNLAYVTGYRSYLTGSKFRPFLAIVPRGEEPILILPNLEVGSGRKTSWCSDVRGWGTGIYADAPDPFALVKTVLEEKKVHRGNLAAELGYGQRLAMTLEQWESCQQCAPEAEWVNVAPIMWKARLRKSSQEIEYIRISCQAADAGFMSAVAASREGVPERDIVRALAIGMLGAGADRPASLIISSGVDRYDMINPYATDRRVEQGDQVIMDFGAWYRGYRSDITRFFYIGEPTKQQRKFSEAALGIFYDTLKAVKPGATAEEVDHAAFTATVDRGYEEYMMHRTGHALGLDVHELPSLGPGDQTVLEPGMVITIEPGIYDFEVGAWRIEDDVLITETGYELLTNAPREIIVR
jgi:Xaa-Pro aminopeptidase